MASETRVPADPRVRGILLALERLGGGELALDGLDDAVSESCRQAWRRLQELDRPARAQAIAAWRAEAASAWPAGLSSLHPSWVEDALGGEHSVILAALAARSPAGQASTTETARELARLAFSYLAPLCESGTGPLAEELCALPPAELLAEITRRGARVLGHSLAGATPSLRARAMASAGEPWAQEIAAASARKLTAGERTRAAGFGATAAASPASSPRERLLAIGLASLRAELEADAEGSRLRVAGRLPAALGRPLIGW